MWRAEPIGVLGAYLEKVQIAHSAKASKFHQSSFVFEKQQYLGLICAQRSATQTRFRYGHSAEDTEHTPGV